MDLEDKNKITKHLTFLKEHISESSLFKCVDHLIEGGVFSMDQGQIIRAKITTEEKCQFFIADLLKSPPEAYALFLGALDKTGNAHIKDILEGNTTGDIFRLSQ